MGLICNQIIQNAYHQVYRLLFRRATGKKGLQIADEMLFRQTAVLHQLSDSRAKYVASCRFFNNRKVDYEKIAAPLIEQTAGASKGRHVLVVQDTSEFNYEHHAGYLSRTDKDLGPTGNNRDIGFFAHPSIVIEKDTGLLLGASDFYLWNRRYDKQDKYERNYPRQPIEDKESYRWIACAQRSKEVLSTAASILLISDRESDIYEEFVLIPDQRCNVLIRSRGNRKLYGKQEKLYEHLKARPKSGSISVQIRQANNRQSRQATLKVRFAKVQIARPKKHTADSTLPEYVELNAICAEETPHSIPSGEKPVKWVLLTTCAVNNLADALEQIRCYGLRWQIELLFASMKSKGVDTEASQLETGKALKSITVMALITALRINQLRLARDDKTNTAATIIFTDAQIKLLEVLTRKLEGNTTKQKNRHRKRTIAWAAWVIGRLGGWKGYQSESPPGNKTMYRGWKDFIRLFEGWSLAQISP